MWSWPSPPWPSESHSSLRLTVTSVSGFPFMLDTVYFLVSSWDLHPLLTELPERRRFCRAAIFCVCIRDILGPLEVFQGSFEIPVL